MHIMNRSSDLRSLPCVVRAFGAAAFALAGFCATAPVHAVERKAMPTGPEQRRDGGERIERMTPEQRQQWRNARPQEDRVRSMQGFGPPARDMRGNGPPPAPAEAMRPRVVPDPQQDMRNQVAPGERQAMRQRFFERQQNNRNPGDVQNPPPPRQLSPAERQQLREQIQQARERYRGNGPKRGPGQ